MYRQPSNAMPNGAHQAIAMMELLLPKITVLTQNVVGLHQDAGSTDVIEIHGSARSLVCPRCPWLHRNLNLAELPPLPRCPHCGAVLRPPVVLFGGELPKRA